jgi:hypothetical protein
MRLALTLVLAIGLPAGSFAEDVVPDLTGTWVGITRSLVFGQTRFHPGDGAGDNQPQIRELEWTMEIAGQDGRVFWGEAWPTADRSARDTLALAIAADGRTIVGAGNDGAHTMTLVSPDRIERCFTQPGTGPSGSIVAACGVYERVR